jgi:hypothetical protein
MDVQTNPPPKAQPLNVVNNCKVCLSPTDGALCDVCVSLVTALSVQQKRGCGRARKVWKLALEFMNGDWGWAQKVTEQAEQPKPNRKKRRAKKKARRK